MVTCTNCDTKINRVAFCSPKCKMQYKRKTPRQVKSTEVSKVVVDTCIHGSKQTYCKVSKCEFYASWR